METKRVPPCDLVEFRFTVYRHTCFGFLQTFDLDYQGLIPPGIEAPGSDGNDAHTVTLKLGEKRLLYFYYKEWDAGNDYIVRVYAEWDRIGPIANSDDNEHFGGVARK